MSSRLLHIVCSALIALILVSRASAQEEVSLAPYAADQTWHIDSEAKYAMRFYLNSSESGFIGPVEWRILDFPVKVDGYLYLDLVPANMTAQALSVEGFDDANFGAYMGPELGYDQGVDLDLDGEPGYETSIPYWTFDEATEMLDAYGGFTVPALPARAEPYAIRARWRAPTGKYIIAECTIYVGYSTGLSVDGGETFTNSLATKLSVVAPPGSVWARLSNDGGFAGARTFEISQSVFDQEWQMAVDYVDKSTRVVYVKFFDRNGGELGTFSDSIIYDPEPPKIVEAKLSNDRPKASKKASPPRNLTLRVKAEDTVSGIDKIEIRRWNKPDKPQQRKLTARISLPRNEGGVGFRISDRAGNWTDWTDLKRPSGDTQSPRLTVSAPKKQKVQTSASRYVLRGNVTDNSGAQLRSIRFRAMGPRDKQFSEPQWRVLGEQNKAGSWTWPIRLGSKGAWIVEIKAYDVEGNASDARIVTITKN